MFGHNSASSSVFGTSDRSSLSSQNKPVGVFFGQPQPQTSSLFGFSTPSSWGTAGLGINTVGTNGTIVKFDLTADQAKYHCITVMNTYQEKSVEELRCEDYLANRKGPQQGSALLGGVFAPKPQTCLFGSTPASDTSLFGSTSPSTSQPGFLFGGQQPQQTGGLFLAQTPFGPSTTSTGFSFPAFDVKPTVTSAPAFGGFGTQTSTFGASSESFSLNFPSVCPPSNACSSPSLYAISSSKDNSNLGAPVTSDSSNIEKSRPSSHSSFPRPAVTPEDVSASNSHSSIKFDSLLAQSSPTPEKCSAPANITTALDEKKCKVCLNEMGIDSETFLPGESRGNHVKEHFQAKYDIEVTLLDIDNRVKFYKLFNICFPDENVELKAKKAEIEPRITFPQPEPQENKLLQLSGPDESTSPEIIEKLSPEMSVLPERKEKILAAAKLKKCSIIIQRSKALQKQSQSVKQVGTYSCLKCHKPFEKPGSLRGHMGSHRKQHAKTNGSPAKLKQLELSPEKTEEKVGKLPKLDRLAKDKHPCFKCGKSISNFSNYNRHLRNIHNCVYCPGCKKGFDPFDDRAIKHIKKCTRKCNWEKRHLKSAIHKDDAEPEDRRKQFAPKLKQIKLQFSPERTKEKVGNLPKLDCLPNERHPCFKCPKRIKTFYHYNQHLRDFHNCAYCPGCKKGFDPFDDQTIKHVQKCYGKCNWKNVSESAKQNSSLFVSRSATKKSKSVAPSGTKCSKSVPQPGTKRFKCNICVTTCGNKGALVRHTQSKHPKLVHSDFFCICGEHKAREYDIRIHQKKCNVYIEDCSSSNARAKNSECANEGTIEIDRPSAETVAQQISTSSQLAKEVSGECPRVFQTESVNVDNQSSFQLEQELADECAQVCNRCPRPRSFLNSANLKRHLQLVHGAKVNVNDVIPHKSTIPGIKIDKCAQDCSSTSIVDTIMKDIKEEDDDVIDMFDNAQGCTTSLGNLFSGVKPDPMDAEIVPDPIPIPDIQNESISLDSSVDQPSNVQQHPNSSATLQLPLLQEPIRSYPVESIQSISVGLQPMVCNANIRQPNVTPLTGHYTCKVCHQLIAKATMQGRTLHVYETHLPIRLYKCKYCSFSSNLWPEDVSGHIKMVHTGQNVVVVDNRDKFKNEIGYWLSRCFGGEIKQKAGNILN